VVLHLRTAFVLVAKRAQQVSDNCFAVLNENNRISDTPLATSAAQVSPSRASGHPQTGERIQ